MKLCKLAFMRLRRMKKRWKLPEGRTLYAHAQVCDVHWRSEEIEGKKFRDERELDEDLMEPVMY